MDNKITYNGKVYNSINDLPEEARKIFEDKDGDNVPDVFKGMLDSAKDFKGASEITTSSYVVDGKTYNSLDEVPEDNREMIRENLSQLGKAGMKPIGNKVEFELKDNDRHNPGGLDSASNELSSNFPFKLIMLFIFLGFMVFFIYSLVKMLSR